MLRDQWRRLEEEIQSKKAESSWTVQKSIEKHEELSVFNEHTCSHVCSSIRGGVKEETSVHALNFNLLFPFLLPFFQGIIWFSFLPSPLWGNGREGTNYL